MPPAECASDLDCCAVAEDEGPPYNNASDVGTYVFCTTDGGNTWVDELRNSNPDASLVDIAALSPLEYWAVGATLGQLGPKAPGGWEAACRLAPAPGPTLRPPLCAAFFHTTDGGKTWTTGTFTGMADTYAIAIDCVAGVNCWVNLLSVLTQESSIGVLTA